MAKRSKKASSDQSGDTDSNETSMSATPLLRLGESAPHFTADSTLGTINFPEDYSGKWVVLFSHCSDFTPVCTSECMAFADLSKEFERYNCAIVGLSPCSIDSHRKWIESIEKNIQYRRLKRVKINFPLIDDQSLRITKLYGIMPSPKDNNGRFPVRALFFIDPEGTVQAINYFPRSVGMSFDEIKRIMLALQTSHSFNVMTPADWKLGDDIILPPAMYCVSREQETARRKEQGYQDWYFCSQPLPKEKIIARIHKKH